MKQPDQPVDVGHSIDRIGQLLPVLFDEYTEAFFYRFDRRDSRSAHQAGEEQSIRSEKVSGSKMSDPTPDIAIDQVSVGQVVKRAADDIRRAEEILHNVYTRLGYLFRDDQDYVPLRDRMRAGDKAPRNVVRTYEVRETYLRSTLAAVRDWLKKAS